MRNREAEINFGNTKINFDCTEIHFSNPNIDFYITEKDLQKAKMIWICSNESRPHTANNILSGASLLISGTRIMPV